MALKPYIGKLHFSVVLLVELEAEHEVDAHAQLRDYECKILSQEWQATNAPEGIKRVQESSYTSDRHVAVKKQAGLALG